MKAKIATVLSAWERSEARLKRKADREAEDSLNQVRKAIKRGEYGHLRQTFETLYGEHLDEEIIGKTWIEEKLVDFDQGELSEDLLEEVIDKSKDKADDGATTQLEGKKLVFKRTARQKLGKPGTSEELRTRLELLAQGYTMLKIMYPDDMWLTDADPDLYKEHLRWINSKSVRNYMVKNQDGVDVLQAPWTSVSHYEEQIRKHATKHVNQKGGSYKTALALARASESLYTREFIQLLATCTVPAAPPPWRNPDGAQWTRPGGSEKGRGKDKGKGKGKGKDIPKAIDMKSFYNMTVDGMPICFDYNNRFKHCNGKKCSKAHVCQLCRDPDKKHPWYMCSIAVEARKAELGSF
jgi:hypothetical protein